MMIQSKYLQRSYNLIIINKINHANTPDHTTILSYPDPAYLETSQDKDHPQTGQRHIEAKPDLTGQ